MADGLNINRNDRFWMDAVGFLASISKGGGYPDFLISWVKETLNILKEDKNRLFLIQPPDGCWGIYINNKDDYKFTDNDGENVFISHRLYKYLKEENAFILLAGLLLHETSEFIMRTRAQKKGYQVDGHKNHGEAVRLEKALLGTKLSDLFIGLVEQELDRRKVILDKHDIFVSGCAVSGEEIVAEINSFKHLDESFILQLAPGQKRQLPYSGGYFSTKAEDFNDPFKLESIDFKTYCRLMQIVDNLFVEESILNGEGPFKELLTYIRGLDFSAENDNFLLRILWLFAERFYMNKPRRDEFLYNMYLIIDEYITYFVMRDVVRRYWRDSRLAKDNTGEITDEVSKKKRTVFADVLKDNTEERLISWFSRMDDIPAFSQVAAIKWEQKIPHYIARYYKKKPEPKLPRDLYSELALHEEVLKIIQDLRLLMNEPRGYGGVDRREDPRVCELKMIRVHFWRDKDIFCIGETIGVYSTRGSACGLAEVIDIKEYSVVIFLRDEKLDVPETGYIKKLEEEDLTVKVSLEAIERIKKGGRIDRFF